MDKILTKDKLSITNREREAFRSIRTNLEFSEAPNQTIVITSSAENDGKTRIGFHLAQLFAHSGKKALFLDADLRKSIILKRLDADTELKGLTHVLSGEVPCLECVYPTDEKGFYIMPCGKLTSKSTELLASEILESVLEELKKEFDYVIIDTPPVGSIIDAAVIARVSDATAMVVSYDTTPYKRVKSDIEQLQKANKNFLGVILNKVEFKKNSYYSHYYGKYYSRYYGQYGKDKSRKGSSHA